MIIMWMHTFKYYRSSVRKKFWFSSKLINFPKTLISSSSQFFLAIEKVMHVYYKKAVVREYPFLYFNIVKFLIFLFYFIFLWFKKKEKKLNNMISLFKKKKKKLNNMTSLYI